MIDPEFAVNYSAAAADLFRAGRIAVDRFKCPAWPDLIAGIQGRVPLYVHLPLRVGAGRGGAINTETRRPPDWRTLESLLRQTDTQQVNVHLAPFSAEFPDIPAGSDDPAHAGRLFEAALRDVGALVARFGPERVVVENVDDGKGVIPRLALRPELIRRVVEETGSCFLLDLAHARLAAHLLGMDARRYIAQLPLAHTTEVHLAGIQPFAGHWRALMRQPGLSREDLGWFADLEPGQLLDHLPLADGDWGFYTWALGEVRRGVWGRPWVVTLEYGGVGRLWELLTDRDALAEQVPRLRELVKGEAELL